MDKQGQPKGGKPFLPPIFLSLCQRLFDGKDQQRGRCFVLQNRCCMLQFPAFAIAERTVPQPGLDKFAELAVAEF